MILGCQITNRLRLKLINIAKGWLRKLNGRYDVEEVVHDAVVNAMTTTVPPGSNWEKHCVYHTISECRRLMYDEKTKANDASRLPPLPLDAAEDVPDSGGVDEEYEDRRDIRICFINGILDKMEAKDSTILNLHYVYGQSTRNIAQFMKVGKTTISRRLEKAKRDFLILAKDQGLDQLVTELNVESDSTYSCSRPSHQSRLDGWYRKDEETDRLCFLGPDGELVHVVRPQEDLKIRCQKLRAGRSHCPDV